MTILRYCLLLISTSPALYNGLPANIRIGGIFESADEIQRTAFAFAVSRVSNLTKDQTNSALEAKIEVIDSQTDAFKAAQKTCQLLMLGVAGIFGPPREPSASQARSICDTKSVPHIMTSMKEHIQGTGSINLYPPTRAIGNAIASVVNHYAWKSLVILYENSRGLMHLQDLLQMSSKPNGPKISLRQLPDTNGHADHDKQMYAPVLKEIKDVMQEFHIVVHASLFTTMKVLQQASGLSMVENYFHYVLSNFDSYTLDLDGYKSSGCNITAFQLVDVDSPVTQSITSDLRRIAMEAGKGGLISPAGIQGTLLPMTEIGIIYDSVMMLVGALIANKHTEPVQISCDKDDTWSDGASLFNSIVTMDYVGVTGRVHLDERGQRDNYEFSVVELGKDGFETLGIWNELSKLNITRNYEKSLTRVIQSLENKTLRVVIKEEIPFVIVKKSEGTLYGNDRYEGYCIDLLREIANYRKFNYTLELVKDGNYGSKEEDGQGRWNGMVGQLQRGESDLAVAALTISYSRSEVIDFTVPFMHLGISILFKKPEKKDPSLFTFLSPLSLDVWIYMLAAYVGVSLMLWILARFSPYEWYNPHPCNPDTDVVENQFTLLNSLWFTVGSLMQQGSDIAPRAASTRLVAGIWWFFTLILISSYTANLAAFLTVERMVSPIESADDLAKQTKIKYGTIGHGSTMTFFKESKIQTYERMWAFMESATPSVFVNNSQIGIAKVKSGDYAFLMESSMLEYAVERQCELMQIGGLLDSKGYGIGLPKGSPYREPISSAILMLQEKTVLTELKEKWWKQKHGGGKCKGEDASKGQHNELGLQNVGGVFVLLLGGLCLAFIISIIEFIYKSSQNAEIDKKSLCVEMWNELKFAMRCHGSKKPARRRQSIIGYVDDGKGSLVPSLTYGGYTAVPTKSDSFLYNT